MPDATPPSDGHGTPRRFARRGFLLGGTGLMVLGGIAAGRWYNLGAGVGASDLTAPEALARAQDGTIVLVDIRRPDEWARTGVPGNAVTIDMRCPDFVEALLAETGVTKDQPIALICARGVRSARLSARLRGAGFRQILDVPEGMLGSGAGPGWIARGLPLRQVAG